MRSWRLRESIRLWMSGLLVLVLWACSSAPVVRRAPPPSPPVAAPVVPLPAPTLVPEPAPVQAFPIAPVTPLDATPLGAAGTSTDEVASESAAVAARFPDPPVSYHTPAFDPGHPGFTSNAELRAILHALVRDTQDPADVTTVRLIQAGSSQSGVPLEALHFSREPVPLAGTGVTARSSRPTVLLVGQQHGDEPAASEALLALAQDLAQGGTPGASSIASVLDRVDVVILPRANPDGAAAGRRLTASGIDANRDQLMLRTPEAQAQAQLVREFNPVVVVDMHEYPVLGRYLGKFSAVQRFDALLQYAMVANLPEFITKASEEWFRLPMIRSLKAQGLSSEWYYTTSADPADKKVSMGDVQPDIGRNVNGLRNSVSFLIETRGVGLGRAHLQRRVHTQYTAAASALRSAAAHADDLVKLRHYVDSEVTAKACQGEVIVEAEETPSEYNLLMLDPQTGADKTVVVSWDSALELTPVKERARPCGYWLGADQTDAALRLRGLGVQVSRLDEAGALRGETYAELTRDLAVRKDAGASVVDMGVALRLKVALVPALLDVRAGGYYVGLDQPLANLAVAALEPDSRNSFASNRIVTDVGSQARVLVRPDLKMTAMP
jgi:hypothetical protein